jgi:methionyl-tRNA synthetase
MIVYKIVHTKLNSDLTRLIYLTIGFFGSNIQGRASSQAKPKFNMITPPPNVTGSLHIGHALTFSLEVTVYFAKHVFI